MDDDTDMEEIGGGFGRWHAGGGGEGGVFAISGGKGYAVVYEERYGGFDGSSVVV